MPTIWIDADAIPTIIKDVICKAANRTSTPAVFVANRPTQLPGSKFLSYRVVSGGFDEADNAIVDACQSGDLVITNDIPLAADAIAKGAQVINNRGEPLTTQNIGAKLNMRDFFDTMRASGIQGRGPAPLTAQDKQAFANGLDKYLAKILRA
ncbi:MAG TPA: YaiI/YqxD family protein [Pseudomonadales bacterium]|nr:YaiI/YqxD family protein [Pseudomonadales bacterium]